MTGFDNMLKFYTTPPIPYPYVMRPIHRKVNFKFLHEIVDIGIYDLLKPPYIHKEKKLLKWEALEPKGWKIVPDYPDIRREHNISEFTMDNVEKSKEMIERFYDAKNPTHVPVIQGYKDDPDSFVEYIDWFKTNHDLPESNAIAIGTICKAGRKKATVEVVTNIRNAFPDLHIHAFGLKLTHFDKVYHLIDSWDSMAWTFPRGRGRGSAKNKVEKIQYFYDYMEVADKLSNYTFGFTSEKINEFLKTAK